MGVEPNITASKAPKDGAWLGRRVRVCFHYDTSQTLDGKVVRDDAEAPGVMIIRLDGGRYVLSTECQWSPL